MEKHGINSILIKIDTPFNNVNKLIIRMYLYISFFTLVNVVLVLLYYKIEIILKYKQNKAKLCNFHNNWSQPVWIRSTAYI